MKLLKSNGFDISEILANLSGFEEEEYEKKDDKDDSTSTIKDFSFKVGDQVNNNEIYIKENNKENNEGKDSDKVKMKKILNMNKKNAKLKEKEEFSFRNNKKIISHSVGDD